MRQSFVKGLVYNHLLATFTDSPVVGPRPSQIVCLSLRLAFAGLGISRERFVRWGEYLDVGQLHMKQCKRFSVALDGTRVGGRDVAYFVVMGTTVDGVTECMWGPPQVILECAKHSETGALESAAWP